MQTIGDLIDKVLEISVEHFNGASYSKEIIKSKVLKLPGATKYYYRVLNPVKEYKRVEKKVLPILTNEEYKILMIVAEEHNVDINKLVSSSRKREIVEARMQAMSIFYAYLFYTYKRTGDVFSRDHSTVIHGIETTNNLLTSDAGFNKSFVKTLAKLKEELPYLFESHDKLNLEFKQTLGNRKVVNGIGKKKLFIQSIQEQKKEIKKLLESGQTY